MAILIAIWLRLLFYYYLLTITIHITFVKQIRFWHHVNSVKCNIEGHLLGITSAHETLYRLCLACLLPSSFPVAHYTLFKEGKPDVRTCWRKVPRSLDTWLQSWAPMSFRCPVAGSLWHCASVSTATGGCSRTFGPKEGRRSPQSRILSLPGRRLWES